MDWLIGVLLLIVGAIIGFFAAKYWFESKRTGATSQTKEQTLKEIMAQQAANHLEQSRRMVDTIQQQCDEMREQMDAYESILSVETQSEDGKQLSYFGEHATMYIRNAQKQQKRKPTVAEFQPRDFSSESSGLFGGSKKQQVVDDKN